MPLSRKKGVQKKVYHKKVLWCPVCQKRINHIELRNKDILEKELEFKTNKSEEDAFVYTLIKKSNECRKNI